MKTWSAQRSVSGLLSYSALIAVVIAHCYVAIQVRDLVAGINCDESCWPIWVRFYMRSAADYVPLWIGACLMLCLPVEKKCSDNCPCKCKSVFS